MLEDDDGAASTDPDPSEDPGRDWTFGLGEIGESEDRELQPGSPKLEHVLFVFLGVLATLFAIFRALFG